jgi:hypothetical protein
VLAGPARQTTNKNVAAELHCVQLIAPVMKHGKDDSQLHLQLSHRVIESMLNRQQLPRARSPRVASQASQIPAAHAYLPIKLLP